MPAPRVTVTQAVLKVEGTTELERLVNRSHILGADPALVVHGGGNTSSKILEVDYFGRERWVLRIKGSGANLATVGPDDFAALALEDVRALRGRKDMSDGELLDYLAFCAVEPHGPRPSIETLVHAFLPALHVDHVHSDAICALTNAGHTHGLVEEALGNNVVVVPYVRAGLPLARAIDPPEESIAIVLEHHGLVTWGETHEECLRRTLDLDRKAREFLAARLAGRTHPSAASSMELMSSPCSILLASLRGAVSRRGRRVLHIDQSQRAFSDRSDVELIAKAGRSTPDHMLWIGRETLVVSPGAVEREAGEFEERRTAEQLRYRDSITADAIDPTPHVALIPGLGCVGIGQTARMARIAAEVAFHTHSSVADTLDAFGRMVWLNEREMSEFEYWRLERDKLTLEPDRSSEFEGHVLLITGAASGLGRDIACDLSRRGANVVVCDIDAEGLQATSEALPEDRSLAVTTDMTVQAEVERFVYSAVSTFGGIDGIVSNAGIAVSGRLAELTQAEWERSLAINATSHFLLTQAVWPILEAQGIGGSLVYVASKNAFNPGAGFGAYSAAKAAEVQIARIAALEGGALGIRANAVNPDAIFAGSRLWSEQMRRDRAKEHGVPPDKLEDFYASRNLLRHHVSGQDVAEAVAFLISKRSAATTGAVLPVDGGVVGAFPR